MVIRYENTPGYADARFIRSLLPNEITVAIAPSSDGIFTKRESNGEK